MKRKDIVPTGREIPLQETDLIVSKTDTTGRITYCNRTFMAIAGYSEAELLGKQHNIVRHPDMPRSAFHLMWETLKQGEEFFAYVKNMASNGDHYWVMANITPSYDGNGRLVGYFSARRKPRREAVAKAEALYAQMKQAEQQAGAREAIGAGAAVLQQTLGGQSYARFVLDL